MSDPEPRSGEGSDPGSRADGEGRVPPAGSGPSRPGEADRSVDLLRFWYRRHADRVYRYARWRAGSREAAEDVVSDVFVEAWRSADAYDPEQGSVESWLLGIARNMMRRRRRRRKREAVPVDPSDIDDRASGVPSPEDDAVTGDRRARLLEAVWELPRADRDLVALAYGAELSSERIADLLETSPGAVRTRLHRVLQRLRNELEAG